MRHWIEDIAIISAKDIAGDLHVGVQVTAGPSREEGRHQENQGRDEAQQAEKKDSNPKEAHISSP
jgi:hypothetical protein